jgi:hypothetical protein
MLEAMSMFTILPHSPGDKSIYVKGPDELSLEVDFDDVFPDAVLHWLHAMVDILNAPGNEIPAFDYEAAQEEDEDEWACSERSSRSAWMMPSITNAPCRTKRLGCSTSWSRTLRIICTEPLVRN